MLLGLVEHKHCLATDAGAAGGGLDGQGDGHGDDMRPYRCIHVHVRMHVSAASGYRLVAAAVTRQSQGVGVGG